ncbi:MAG: hypothetical protein F6K00_22545 [Leptolyngbya sp. SIOISBB]|nr:hypothetical protein [Leptolyngbya sp. SIOISBB]
MLELNLKSGRNEISFKSQGYKLAAHLYAPEGFNADGTEFAVVAQVVAQNHHHRLFA